MTHWTATTMAKALGISVGSVQRIWRAHGLQPHRVRQFKLSGDPQFAAKLRDINGLYVDPPAHAVVLSLDEKSQIQALDPTQPRLLLTRGRCGTMTHDYKRHGTTTLFAALNVLEGKVIGRCMQRHRVRRSGSPTPSISLVNLRSGRGEKSVLSGGGQFLTLRRKGSGSLAMSMMNRRSALAKLSALLGVLSGRLGARTGAVIAAPAFAAMRRRNELFQSAALTMREAPLAATQFGAIGNGSADDTAAINSAMTAAATTVDGVYGAKVLLPKGRYRISNTLNIPNGVHLCGESPEASHITAAAEFNAAAMISNTDHNGKQEYAFVSNLALNITPGAAMRYGLDLTSVFVNSFIRDCIVVGIPGIGMHIAAGAACGPVFVENNWIVNSTHQNILVEELNGNRGFFNNVNFYGNTSEHCAEGFANFHIKGRGSLIGISIFAHHIEQSRTGAGTYCLYVDGCSNLLADNIVLDSGGGILTGIHITKSAYNSRQHYRNVSNANWINPVLDDELNGVRFGGIDLPWYSTADVVYYTGQINPAKDNTVSLGGADNRWKEVYATNGTINTSDYRVKRNIVELDYGLNELLRLMPVSFDRIDGQPGRQLGLVAQAVADVIPEIVVHGDRPEALLGLKYSDLIPVIIHAIQQLEAEHDALRAVLRGEATP